MAIPDKRYGAALLAALQILVSASLCRSQELSSMVSHYDVPVNNAGGVAECLACHDDVTARMGDYRQLRLPSGPNPSGSHFVDIVYPSVSKSNYTGRDEVAAAGFRLPGGKVVCITCHDLRLQTENHLVVQAEGSRICFACHKL